MISLQHDVFQVLFQWLQFLESSDKCFACYWCCKISLIRSEKMVCIYLYLEFDLIDTKNVYSSW